MNIAIDVVLLLLLAVTAVAILRIRSLFAAAMLAAIYSFLSASLFTVMDAVDVAFTEAAVGVGISTILVVGTIALVGRNEKERPSGPNVMALAVCVFTGGVLMYGTLDMPPYGSPDNPVHQHVAPRYLADPDHEIGVPNIVTSVLSSYRGYDTMGETTVVFTALVGVMLLLSGPKRREDEVTVAAASVQEDAA